MFSSMVGRGRTSNCTQRIGPVGRPGLVDGPWGSRGGQERHCLRGAVRLSVNATLTGCRLNASGVPSVPKPGSDDRRTLWKLVGAEEMTMVEMKIILPCRL